MKNIVVFGASGDIGRYFVDYFIKNYSGCEYRLVACGRRKENPFTENEVEYISLDICDEEEFRKLPDSVYAVVDLAGYMPARMEGYFPRKYIDVNGIGTLNILNYCRNKGADRILFSQSFGDIKDHSTENVLLKPYMSRQFSYTSDHTVYVLTKCFAVDLIENFHQMYGIKSFIFRLPTIYLYSDIDYFYVDGVRRKIGYRSIIDKAIRGEDIEVWGDPLRAKDMIYVKDLCQMLYKACFVEDIESSVYNAGTGIGTTLIDQIKGIIEVFCSKDKISNILMRPDLPNAPEYIMDITNAVNELDYSPKYSYIEMLRDFKTEMERR